MLCAAGDSGPGGLLDPHKLYHEKKQGQCSGSYLEHDGEEHHHNRRGDKVILGFDMLSVQQHHQSERHRPSQATVRHHHLVDLVQWNETETVQNPGLTNHT